jgi:PEP-CTERM motif
MRKLLVSIAVASAFVSAAPVASAATYNFSECLAGNCNSLSTSVGALTLTDILGGVSFSFTSSSDLFKTDSFIAGLFFNGPIGGFAWNGPQTLKSVAYDFYPSGADNKAKGYSWDFKFPTGSNKDRFLSGDSATWIISGNGIDVSDFTSADKLAVNLKWGNNESAWIGGVAAVPEPETYAMFLAGMVVIGAIVRRRNATV